LFLFFKTIGQVTYAFGNAFYFVAIFSCRWPVCSAVCQHEDLECSVLSLGNAPSSKSDARAQHDYYRHDALLVLKCLLLQSSQPERWKALLEMQSHEEERRGTELQQEAEQRIVRYLEERFLQRLKTTRKLGVC